METAFTPVEILKNIIRASEAEDPQVIRWLNAETLGWAAIAAVGLTPGAEETDAAFQVYTDQAKAELLAEKEA